MTHGVSKNGTIGGIAKLDNDVEISYCLKPDGTRITSSRSQGSYMLPIETNVRDIVKMTSMPNGKQKSRQTKIEYWGKDVDSKIPTSISDKFSRPDGSKAALLRSRDEKGNKITEINMPSGRVVTKTVSPNGDTVIIRSK